MGQGTIGEFLEFGLEDQFLFMSQKGTWRILDKGVFTYEISNEGRTIVYGKTKEKTSKLKYSTDYGQSFSESMFSDKPLTILNIVTDSLNIGFHFLIKTEEGVTILVAIDELFNVAVKKCETSRPESMQENSELAKCLFQRTKSN